MIKTERLYLRNLREEDVPAIVSWRNDPVCARYQRWEAASEEAVTDYVRNFRDSVFLSNQEEQHYAVCAGEHIVGDLSYFCSEEDRCVTLGITIATAYQRRGYARELLAAVVSVVRKACPKLDIVALIDRENTPSLSLFEGLGFRPDCYAESIGSWVYVIDGETGRGSV